MYEEEGKKLAKMESDFGRLHWGLTRKRGRVIGGVRRVWQSQGSLSQVLTLCDVKALSIGMHRILDFVIIRFGGGRGHSN